MSLSRMSAAGLAAIVALGLAAVAPASASAAPSPAGFTFTTRQLAASPQGPIGTFKIRSLYGDGRSCLDADANGGGNGTRVQTWACNGTSQQQWTLYSDGSLHNGRFPSMCLDADTNGGGRNGTRVQLWQCNGTTQQKWEHPQGDLAFYNLRFLNNHNTCLDRDINHVGNGAQAQLWQKNFQAQQWWEADS